ncbi:NUMOD1 domain-containing DNA-binding protein [Oceanicola sp. D3]|uniref:NUMOD1 domain-containing DNA-binding protein n=1 Tax=Oceanicola sp. D3 TaxID=2587163 RepID=UPI0020C811E4|nr:NUMOD1 domain-containing DNA-binding protein [Oceanicola sp. D3]
MSHATVSAAHATGRLAQCGLGQGKGLRRSVMPVRIRGRVYTSVRSAARALKVSESTIRNAVAKGREDFVAAPASMKTRRGTPVNIAGVEFPSMRSAALALGLKPTYIRTVKARGSCQQRLLAAAMAYLARQEAA